MKNKFRKKKIVKQIGFSEEMLYDIRELAVENELDVSAMIRLLLSEAIRNRRKGK